MEITVKCPNCFQQVSKDNRYCIFCGYDLTQASSSSTISDPIPFTPRSSATSSISYDGPCYCPKGHDVPDPSLGFCPICGSPLVNDPSSCVSAVEESKPMIPPMPPHSRINRTCKCGYICDDTDLSFCPSCGLPLDTSISMDDPGWICVCGAANASEMGFCVSCGKPKGWRLPEPEPITKHDEPVVPIGMKPPKDSDLDIKSKYGN